MGIIGTSLNKMTVVHIFFPKHLPEFPFVPRDFYSGPLKNVAKVELEQLEIIQVYALLAFKLLKHSSIYRYKVNMI